MKTRDKIRECYSGSLTAARVRLNRTLRANDLPLREAELRFGEGSRGPRRRGEIVYPEPAEGNHSSPSAPRQIDTPQWHDDG